MFKLRVYLIVLVSLVCLQFGVQSSSSSERKLAASPLLEQDMDKSEQEECEKDAKTEVEDLAKCILMPPTHLPMYSSLLSYGVWKEEELQSIYLSSIHR